MQCLAITTTNKSKLFTALFGLFLISRYVTTRSSIRILTHFFQVFINLTILITITIRHIRIPDIIHFTCTISYWFFIFIPTFVFHFCLQLGFLTSNLYLQSNETCFATAFYLFSFLMILNTFRFMSSI